MSAFDACLLAESVARNRPYVAVEVLQVLLSSASGALLVAAARTHWTIKARFHPSLNYVLCGFALAILPREAVNIVGFSSNLVRVSTYTDPCSLQTVGWVVLVLRSPRMFYTVVSSAALVSVLIERLVALKYAKSYEKSDPRLGLGLLVMTVAVGLAVPCYEYADLNLWTLLYATTASTPATKQLVYYAVVTIVDVVCVIALVLFRHVNMKRRRSVRSEGGNYTLAESYQLQENVNFMRLFLPFATVYFVATAVYHLAQMFMRNVVPADTVTRIVFAELLYSASILCTVFALVAYLRMLRKLRDQVHSVIHYDNEGNVYFDHFNRLMGVE